MPSELMEAVTNALEREAAERDVEKRAQLLTATRATIEAWTRGRLTTEQAVLLIRLAAAPE